MGETLTDKLTKTPEDRRLYERERTVLEVTELICELMEKQGVSRDELAGRKGWHRYAIDCTLNGDSNTRLCDLFDLLCALGHRVHFSVEPLEEHEP